MGQRITQNQMVRNAVYDSIIVGKIKPGERVSEKALARTLGCSIIPVREALSHLISLGVFEKIPHNGTFARELTPQEMMAHADSRLVSYTYAVGRAAARPDPEGLAMLKAAFIALAQSASGVTDLQLAKAPESEWLEFLNCTIKELLHIYKCIVLAADLPSQREAYERGDLLYILSSRSIWTALSRESMIGFIQDVFVDDPMSCFLPAIEARDSAEAQRLHFAQHQRMTLNVMQRLATAGVELSPPGSTSIGLTGATFRFSSQR
ncbi:MAG: GntR family transcriptional regulator [Deltaproteobacteria bacterium]|nr:GntR family transcriptional regulator [Deltaproteobacteria bacterium]